MRLTMFTDYALRTLILAASKGDRNVTIEEAAAFYGISAPHLKKVVRTLTGAGFLEAQRGRSGGFRLAMPPETINLGQVIRVTEPDFALVECFREDNRCLITRACRLPSDPQSCHRCDARGLRPVHPGRPDPGRWDLRRTSHRLRTEKTAATGTKGRVAKASRHLTLPPGTVPGGGPYPFRTGLISLSG